LTTPLNAFKAAWASSSFSADRQLIPTRWRGERTLCFVVLILYISTCIVHIGIIVIIVIKVIFLYVQLGFGGVVGNSPPRLRRPGRQLSRHLGLPKAYHHEVIVVRHCD